MASPSVVLSQNKPGATTLTGLYTVPAGRRARVTIISCNQHATSDPIRVALAKNGAADAVAQYIRYGVVLEQAAADQITVLLGAGDVVRVYSTNGTTSFAANGYEDDAP